MIAPPTTVLLITGPNTGGKTVALKTAGLLALMAQAGLHVPAEAGSRLPVFRSLFADIGDEQSIAASLSTFSWHITNIASMDRTLDAARARAARRGRRGHRSGRGRRARDGGGRSLPARGALVIATTHYDALKTYASTTAGVMRGVRLRPGRLRAHATGSSTARRAAASRSRSRPPRAEPGDHRRARAEPERGDAQLPSISPASTTTCAARARAAAGRTRAQALAEPKRGCRQREEALREREEQFRRR